MSLIILVFFTIFQDSVTTISEMEDEKTNETLDFFPLGRMHGGHPQFITNKRCPSMYTHTGSLNENLCLR